MLKDEKYWDLTVLRLYLDNCDEVLFDDPKAGLEMAKVAPKLALKIPQRRPYDWRHLTDPSEKQLLRELRVRSHAVLGGAYRAGGMMDESEGTYQTAGKVCDSGPVSLFARADLYRRLARLRSSQKSYDAALDLLEFAIKVFDDRDPDCFAASLLMKGYVLGENGRHAEAVPYFGEVLKLVKPKQRSSRLAKRTFHSAVHNMAFATSKGCFPSDVRRALVYVREAKKFFARKARSINKYKLFWVEGRLVARLGLTRTAERRLRPAFKQFLALGAPVEAALVGLELGLVYWITEEWQKLEELALETYNRFRELSSDTEALAALKLWMEGAKMRELTQASMVSTRDLFERMAEKRRP